LPILFFLCILGHLNHKETAMHSADMTLGDIGRCHVETPNIGMFAQRSLSNPAPNADQALQWLLANLAQA
jgi:hypothetical protein